MYKTSSNFSISCFRHRLLARIMLTVFCCSLLHSVSLAQQPTATIKTLNGDVLISGQTVAVGTILSAGDTIQTQAGASVVLELSDGSEIHLGENTQINIADLVQTATGERISKLTLLRGWLRAFLSPDHQKEGSSFTVETPNAQVGVKFSQPDVEVSYDPEKQETIGIAHTVELIAINLLTNEEVVVPVGSSVIIIGLMMKVITGTTAAAIAAGTEAAAAETTTGMGTGTKVAIGAGALAAAGGVAAVAAGSGGGGDGGDGGGSETVESSVDLSGTWYFSGTGSVWGCPDDDICFSHMFPNTTEDDFVRNGPFTFSNSAMNVNQTDNALSGTWIAGDQFAATLNGTINGDSVAFTIEGVDRYGNSGTTTTAYTGIINGNTITGTFDGSGSWENPEGESGPFAWSGNFTVIIE